MKFLSLFITFIALIELVNARSIVKCKAVRTKPKVIDEDGLTEMEKVKFILVDKNEGATLLTQEDDFVNALSDFDRSARLYTSANVTKEEYISYVKEQTLDWTKEETEILYKMINETKILMKDYKIKFPKTINIIKTTGLEEGNSAYCRGKNNIIFSKSYFSREYDVFLGNFIHELFHIFSKNNLEIREELYHSIGFYKTGELVLPSEYSSVKITNPDSVTFNYYFKGIVDGKEINLMPLLYALTPYNDEKKGQFFEYMNVVLCEVNIGETNSTLVGENGNYNCIQYPFKEVTNFLETVGENTEYTINAEEIFADNFKYLVTKKDVKSPQIIDNMKEILNLK